MAYQTPIVNGWFSEARRVPSPNCDECERFVPELLVIHCISLPAGDYSTSCVESFFTNQLDCDEHSSFDDIRELNVSSHFFIRRDGELIQFVPVNKMAWHAGESSFQGREQCNEFSIGVELEGIDTETFTDQQYSQLTKLSLALMKEFAISADRIVGHSDIAPGRKTDPGVGFDWARLRASVGEKV